MAWSWSFWFPFSKYSFHRLPLRLGNGGTLSHRVEEVTGVSEKHIRNSLWFIFATYSAFWDNWSVQFQRLPQTQNGLLLLVPQDSLHSAKSAFTLPSAFYPPNCVSMSLFFDSLLCPPCLFRRVPLLVFYCHFSELLGRTRDKPVRSTCHVSICSAGSP